MYIDHLKKFAGRTMNKKALILQHKSNVARVARVASAATATATRGGLEDPLVALHASREVAVNVRKNARKKSLAEIRKTARRGIYGLVDPVSGRVRYVGQSERIEVRFTTHSGSGGRKQPGSTRTPRMAWLSELHARGLLPGLRVLQEIPVGDMRDAENEWIFALQAQGDADLNVRATGKTELFRLRRENKDLRELVSILEARLQGTV